MYGFLRTASVQELYYVSLEETRLFKVKNGLLYTVYVVYCVN